MKGQTYLILSLIVLILISIFSITNMGAVDVTYFFWTVKSPLILVILFSVLLGVIISGTVSAYRIVKLRKELKQVKAKKIELQVLLDGQAVSEDFNEDAKSENPLEETKTIN